MVCLVAPLPRHVRKDRLAAAVSAFLMGMRRWELLAVIKSSPEIAMLLISATEPAIVLTM
jgi:hypothetical protein